jgi:hypothetical protein
MNMRKLRYRMHKIMITSERAFASFTLEYATSMVSKTEL